MISRPNVTLYLLFTIIELNYKNDYKPNDSKKNSSLITQYTGVPRAKEVFVQF
ncbi:hypothetical protein FHW89_001709 [Mucilaginibacter sp. SG564]|nr:hypothetical protein [Mucilaginibacter sp. SG564]